MMEFPPGYPVFLGPMGIADIDDRRLQADSTGWALAPTFASIQALATNFSAKVRVPSLSAAVPTSQRPAVALIAGMSVFDTTLGKPIWWSGTAWVDATGTAV